MLVQLIGGAPRVIHEDGKIGVFDQVEGEDHGFVFLPGAAVTVAVRLLRAVAAVTGADRLTQPVEAIELTGGAIGDDGDRVAKLVFTIDGAPLAVDLTAVQVAELAAGFTALSRNLDTPEQPRRDR